MKLLQILVWILLFMLSYDLVTYLVSQRSEGQPTAGDGAGKWSSIFGYDGTDLEPFVNWLVGGSCVLGFYAMRLIFKRFLPKPTEIPDEILQKTKIEAAMPRKRESFLTCKISESTINSYNTEELNYDIPGQLSTSQLQVLLEELKFSVDEKFEEIDAWIAANDHELKLWLKRMERVETEISYIRHQIFILMSTSAKVGSNLCIGDVPETRDHVETLRDLSTILAQVKKQFHEDESKGKMVREYGDHQTLFPSPKKLLLEEVKEKDSDECNIVEIRNIEPEEKFMILKELNVKQVKKKQEELFEEKKESVEKEDIPKPERKESVESTAISINTENQEDSNSSNLSGKEDNPNDEKNDAVVPPPEKDFAKRIEEINEVLLKKVESSRKSRSLNPSTPRKRDSPIRSPVKTPSPDRKVKESNKENYVPTEQVIDESSANLIIIGNDTHAEESLNEACSLIKESMARSSSPKRTVRFAQDKRDVSPSKGPTWLAIKREVSPSKTNYVQGGSDPKVYSASYNEGLRVTRDSASCPTVDDRRPSRRTILEKELTNLERRVSPSPTRQKHRRSNVRSKVADYIRGSKN